jgi:hypothetical protein
LVAITERLEAALEYLHGLRHGGLWRGFPTLAGESDLWVSGFVAAHLSNVELVSFDTAPTVEALLGSAYTDGGWGYSANVPPDADSTAWCAMAVAEADAADVLTDARRVLEDHRDGNGFATYLPESGIVKFIEASSSSSVRGWTSAHPDVTAAVLLAGVPGRGADDSEDVLQDLVASQTGAGFIASHWWRGPFYGSALVLRALNTRGRRLEPRGEGLMYRGLARKQLADGGFGLGASSSSDPFSTAFGLEALCRLAHLDDDGRRDQAANALLASQGKDGGWAGDFVLRIPAPDVVNPRLVDVWSRGTGGGNSFVPDVDGVFATAAAAHSLDLWHWGPIDMGAYAPVTAAQSSVVNAVVVRSSGE